MIEPLVERDPQLDRVEHKEARGLNDVLTVIVLEREGVGEIDGEKDARTVTTVGVNVIEEHEVAEGELLRDGVLLALLEGLGQREPVKLFVIHAVELDDLRTLLDAASDCATVKLGRCVPLMEYRGDTLGGEEMKAVLLAPAVFTVRVMEMELLGHDDTEGQREDDPEILLLDETRFVAVGHGDTDELREWVKQIEGVKRSDGATVARLVPLGENRVVVDGDVSAVTTVSDGDALLHSDILDDALVVRVAELQREVLRDMLGVGVALWQAETDDERLLVIVTVTLFDSEINALLVVIFDGSYVVRAVGVKVAEDKRDTVAKAVMTVGVGARLSQLETEEQREGVGVTLSQAEVEGLRD